MMPDDLSCFFGHLLPLPTIRISRSLPAHRRRHHIDSPVGHPWALMHFSARRLDRGECGGCPLWLSAKPSPPVGPETLRYTVFSSLVLLRPYRGSGFRFPATSVPALTGRRPGGRFGLFIPTPQPHPGGTLLRPCIYPPHHIPFQTRSTRARPPESDTPPPM